MALSSFSPEARLLCSDCSPPLRQERGLFYIEKQSFELRVLHPSRSDYMPPAKADAFVRSRGGVPTALLIDPSGEVGHAYGAQTANHMFIVGKDGVLVYARGIDDGQTFDPKKVLQLNNYVRAAREDLYAGKPLHVAKADPFGCSIAYAG